MSCWCDAVYVHLFEFISVFVLSLILWVRYMFVHYIGKNWIRDECEEAWCKSCMWHVARICIFSPFFLILTVVMMMSKECDKSHQRAVACINKKTETPNLMDCDRALSPFVLCTSCVDQKKENFKIELIFNVCLTTIRAAAKAHRMTESFIISQKFQPMSWVDLKIARQRRRWRQRREMLIEKVSPKKAIELILTASLGLGCVVWRSPRYIRVLSKQTDIRG